MQPHPTVAEGTPPRYTTCWACHLTVEVPKTGNEWVAQFKCGWCGAVTDMKPISSKARYGLLLSPTSARKAHRCTGCLISAAQFFTAGFVVTLLLTIMTVGFFGLLPNLYHDPGTLFWHQLITIFLSINISVNYAMAALKGSKSKDTTLPRTSDNSVPKGLYDNYRYCLPCQSVKAPWAHHCRTCNACIDDMDHHCPFIANCVGRRNLHNFLLFLFWTGIGAMYAMLTCLLIIGSSWQALVHRRGHKYRGSIVDFTLSFTASLPWFTLAACYMFVVCFTGSIGVFLLLGSQLRQLQRGQSYIESIKNGKSPPRYESTYASLVRVLGGRNPCMWFFPFFFAKNPAYQNVDNKTS